MSAAFIRRPFRYSFCNATFILIAVNVAVFLLTRISSRLEALLSMNVVMVVHYHCFWQPVTYMFTHANVQHILFNMLGLLFFGLPVERSVGSKEFLLLYFFCGIMDGLLSLALYYLTGFYHVFLLGASGAVYSLLLAYAVIFPRSQIFVFGIIPLPAPVMVALYAAVEFFSQFTASSTAHFTHLTGFVLAWLYLRVRMGVDPLKVWRNAWR
ncbi:MAG: rhomboid family intramembrane serine protease [Treponema sp.]|nr:rhomboid family intramembrane serine protease [Treponema sp.]